MSDLRKLWEDTFGFEQGDEIYVHVLGSHEPRRGRFVCAMFTEYGDVPCAIVIMARYSPETPIVIPWHAVVGLAKVVQ